MGGSKRVAFIAPDAITASIVKGGAQTVGAQLYKQFVSLGWDVRVLQSAAWLDSVAPQAKFADTLLEADITVVANLATRRVENIPPSDAEHLVRGSDLVVVMDRWVGRIVSDGCVVLLLSNLAYANEPPPNSQAGTASGYLPTIWPRRFWRCRGHTPKCTWYSRLLLRTPARETVRLSSAIRGFG